MHRSTDCVVHSSGNRKTAEHLDIARIIRVALVLDWYVHRDFALLSLPPFAHSYVWASEWSKVPVIKMRIGWNHFLKTLLCLQVVFFQATLKKRIGIYWGECTASQAKLLTDINAQGALNACFLINRQLTSGEHGVDLHKHLLNNRRGNKKTAFCQLPSVPLPAGEGSMPWRRILAKSPIVSTCQKNSARVESAFFLTTFPFSHCTQ